MKIIRAKGDDMTAWHEYSGKSASNPTGVCDIKLVRFILENYHIFIIGKIPYIYDGGVYHKDEDETILKEIIQVLIFDKLVTINVINRIYNLIISTNSIQRKYEDLNNYPKHWINFRNCFLDVVEWQEIPHSPNCLSVNQIPHIFKTDANPVGKVTNEFINFAIPDKDDREVLWQFYGYCMTTDCSLQKFMIFKGQGGTGKSLIIRIIETMIGRENTSSISLQQLNERFYPYMLLGKLLNACADIPSKAMEAVDGIKKATGEDSLFAEKKGKDGFSFNSYAKLIFSANEIPINIEEKSEALYRRMMIIKMENKPVKKNPHLWGQLAREIDYSIMTACRALQRMYAVGTFRESQNIINNVQEVYKEADTVVAFLEERTKKLEGKTISTSDLFTEYEAYCKENGRMPLSSHGFHRNMKNKGYVKRKSATCWKYDDLVILDDSIETDEKGFVKVPEDEQGTLPFN